MRKLLLLSTLVFSACGVDGNGPLSTPDSSAHVPEMSNLTLSSDSVLYMEGSGRTQLTASFDYTDVGQDLLALEIFFSDGTKQAVPIGESAHTVTGTLTETFTVNTSNAGLYTAEMWLVDRALQSSNHMNAEFEVVEHEPEISTLTLTPDHLLYMQGDGSATVTAKIEFSDIGADIATLMIEITDGDDVTTNIFAIDGGLSGTITQQFSVATTAVTSLALDICLIDAADEISAHYTTELLVSVDPYTWLERYTKLPHVLNDVAVHWWEHANFIAVGDAGTIMTSPDGKYWVNQTSGTTVDLHAVGCDLYMGCIVAGDDGTILSSTDGQIWKVYYDSPENLSLHAVSDFPYLPLVAGGTNVTTDKACILSEDDGVWTKTEPLQASGQHITGMETLLVPGDGAYPDFSYHTVATLQVSPPGQAKVLTSTDGLTWVEVYVSDSVGSLFTITEHNQKLWAGGTGGKVYSSSDGINWESHATPASTSNITAVFSDGYLLMAQGYSEAIGLGDQIGVFTADGGETWEEAVIGAGYETRGLAFADDRWVSVGRLLSDPEKGAIYTTQ